MFNKTNQAKKFDPEAAFFQLPIVRCTTSFIVFIAIGSWFVITIYSDLWWNFDPTYKGFNNFIDFYKFPISILALLIPIGAIFVANHRSEQTKQQLSIAQNQNKFINYYKHLEEFQKYAEKRLDELSIRPYFQRDAENIKGLNIRKLHNQLFPNVLDTGVFTVNIELVHKLEDICLSLPRTNADSDARFPSDYCRNVEETFEKLSELLVTGSYTWKNLLQGGGDRKDEDLTHFSEKYGPNLFDVSGNYKGITIAYQIIDRLYRIELALRIVSELSHFDSSYDDSDSIYIYEKSREFAGIELSRKSSNDIKPDTIDFMEIKALRGQKLDEQESDFHNASIEELIKYAQDYLEKMEYYINLMTFIELNRNNTNTTDSLS